jgi:hypothetical protein
MERNKAFIAIDYFIAIIMLLAGIMNFVNGNIDRAIYLTLFCIAVKLDIIGINELSR